MTGNRPATVKAQARGKAVLQHAEAPWPKVYDHPSRDLHAARRRCERRSPPSLPPQRLDHVAGLFCKAAADVLVARDWPRRRAEDPDVAQLTDELAPMVRVRHRGDPDEN